MTIITKNRPEKAVGRDITLWQLDLADTEANRAALVPALREFLDGTKHHIVIQADMGVYMPSRGDIEGDSPEDAIRLTAQGAYFGTKGVESDLSQVARRLRGIASKPEYQELFADAHLEHIVPTALAD